jgi:hypothetical protein
MEIPQAKSYNGSPFMTAPSESGALSRSGLFY